MGIETGEAYSIVWLIAGIGLFSLMQIGSCILLALCVYSDALYRRVDNAMMWAVLSGFFNIAALIYIIIQVSKKSQPMRCMQCGEFLAPNSLFCQRCGRPLDVPSPEEMNKYDKRRKLFLWLWIGSLVFAFVFLTVFICIFVMNIITIAG